MTFHKRSMLEARILDGKTDSGRLEFHARRLDPFRVERGSKLLVPLTSKVRSGERTLAHARLVVAPRWSAQVGVSAYGGVAGCCCEGVERLRGGAFA